MMLYPIALSYLQKAFLNVIMEKSFEMVPVSFKLSKFKHYRLSLVLMELCSSSRWPQLKLLLNFCVQNGNECYCGDSQPLPDVHQKVAESECAVPCPGNGEETCGGPYRMRLYSKVTGVYRNQLQLPLIL